MTYVEAVVGKDGVDEASYVHRVASDTCMHLDASGGVVAPEAMPSVFCRRHYFLSIWSFWMTALASVVHRYRREVRANW